jgi:Flp pilus assembly protein TadD
VQKPFSPDEIRSIVMGALNRRDAARESDQAPDYDECLDRARAEIGQTRLEDAGSWVRRALALDPSRPDAPNLLGALEEMAGHPAQAQKYYRAAVELDAKYRAAWANLERSTTMGGPRGKIDLGDSQRRHR